MSQLPVRPKRLAIAIASALSAPAFLAGCAEERVDAAIYTDVPACIAGGNDALACEASFADAAKQHVALAPQFLTRADCEAEFGAGACADAPALGVEPGGETVAVGGAQAAEAPAQRQEAGGGFFYPLMMGYLIGSSMRGLGAQPLYRGRDGSWRNPGGFKLGTATGAVSVAKAATATPAARTTVTSRGGFTAPRASSYGG